MQIIVIITYYVPYPCGFVSTNSSWSKIQLTTYRRDGEDVHGHS